MAHRDTSSVVDLLDLCPFKRLAQYTRITNHCHTRVLKKVIEHVVWTIDSDDHIGDHMNDGRHCVLKKLQ